MQEVFAFTERGFQILKDMGPDGQRFSKVMHACHKRFVPYHIILEEPSSRSS